MMMKRAAVICVVALSAQAGVAQVAQNPEIASQLDAMGQAFNPETIGATFGIYKPLHASPDASVSVLTDQSYGSDGRNMLDVYRPAEADGSAPIVVFAHGGGFVRGSKDDVAHIGAWLAQNGMVGVTFNYRLAPEAVWPSGIEDQAAVVDWIRTHPDLHKGNPDRIIVMGNSAGTAHVAGYLGQGRPEGVIAAVLISPPALELTDHPLDPARDATYFTGDDLGAQSPLAGLVASEVPLMVALAQYDIPLVQAQTATLLAAEVAAKARLPMLATAYGHNHISIVEHLGTEDRVFGEDILAFIRLQVLRADRP
ncbi:Carboxylesterase [Aquimixticola soesokkakensis]|uniref:Carboxylesterase n=1 Tax=Aquimixticola soesokkakensis TaxID=1519096 RepID=A0A1Y5SYK7_9RHOB|nr:alpha/beta hydrolase [Aquimixticola soesokkakensis]SLN51313.1 Carboxylesterase [Aquimixticola soesokkakensis]